MGRTQPATSIFRSSVRVTAFAIALLCVLATIDSSGEAQTLNVLHVFTSVPSGTSPWAGPIIIGGNLYGTTDGGGIGDNGTVFELKHRGSGWILETLYKFLGGTDGSGAYAGVVQGPDGKLYGVTYTGGNGYGTVFRVFPQPTICAAADCPWQEEVLYRFQGGSDGSLPGNEDALAFDRAGNIYGTTRGDRTPDGNAGTVFELSPSSGGWTETVLHRFVGGELPLAGVTFDAAGNLYGTTAYGGNGYGTVYELSPSGNGWVYQAIYTFHNTGDGGNPWGGLAKDAAGDFYGTTTVGNGGTIFQLQPSDGGWTFSTLYQGFPSDVGPLDTPTLDSAGNIYGTVLSNHESNAGLVFKLTPSNGGWTETNLAIFQVNGTAEYPDGGVAVDSQGNVFGTTQESPFEYGTVWEITPH